MTGNDTTRILLIDDDPNLRRTLSDILRAKGYDVLVAKDGAEGLDRLKEGLVNLVLIDLRLPDIPGIEVLDSIKAESPTTEAIILTGHATLHSAIEATNKGAFSYLQKPYEIVELMLHIRRAIEKQQAMREREAMQLKMLTASKLASLGEIATGIAHEINQPLTYISGLIQTLQMHLEEHTINKERLRGKLDVAYRQVQRIDNIIQHLRTFGRPAAAEKEPIDLEAVFNSTLLLMGERIRLRNIELVKCIAPDLPKILGNANRIEQVFLNLLQNAVDALSEKRETAVIEVDMFPSEKRDSISIRVSDNGKGIEEKSLDRIFEPFFTTKEVGKGTGLGLSIAYGIIRDHNGTITCESAVNRGSVFTIVFPAMGDRNDRE